VPGARCEAHRQPGGDVTPVEDVVNPSIAVGIDTFDVGVGVVHPVVPVAPEVRRHEVDGEREESQQVLKPLRSDHGSVDRLVPEEHQRDVEIAQGDRRHQHAVPRHGQHDHQRTQARDGGDEGEGEEDAPRLPLEDCRRQVGSHARSQGMLEFWRHVASLDDKARG